MRIITEGVVVASDFTQWYVLRTVRYSPLTVPPQIGRPGNSTRTPAKITLPRTTLDTEVTHSTTPSSPHSCPIGTSRSTSRSTYYGAVGALGVEGRTRGENCSTDWLNGLCRGMRHRFTSHTQAQYFRPKFLFITIKDSDASWAVPLVCSSHFCLLPLHSRFSLGRFYPPHTVETPISFSSFLPSHDCTLSYSFPSLLHLNGKRVPYSEGCSFDVMRSSTRRSWQWWG